MEKEAFGKLLQKYLEGRCTEEDERLVDKWYDLLSENPTDSAAAVVWDLEQEERWERVQKKIRETNPGTVRRMQAPSSRKGWAWVGVAASIVLVAGWLLSSGGSWGEKSRSDQAPGVAFSGGTGVLQPSGFGSEAAEMVEVVNATGEAKQQVLSDGSKATLYPGSRLRYPAQAQEGLREVMMEGEVFFEVEKDAARPFLVYAGEVVTKVLGTSFTVKTEGQEVEVSVRTGKVAVQKNAAAGEATTPPGQGGGVVLRPNQKARYRAQSRKMEVGLVEMPVRIPGTRAGQGETFIFQDDPLSAVVRSMKQAYGVEISAPGQLLQCPVTANLSDEPFFSKLDLICAAIQAEYWVEGTRIVIHGRGCD